ncbi:interleukin-1 receptor-associated kinase 4-like [Argonauta hians]
MHRNASITKETFLRVLPLSVVRQLCKYLDPNDVWEDLLENIPLHIDTPDSPPRYTAQDSQNIQDRSRRSSKSPTRIMLEDWGMQNPRIKHLMQALLASDLVAAAEYLAIDVLKCKSLGEFSLESENTGACQQQQQQQQQVPTISSSKNFDTHSTKSSNYTEKSMLYSLPQEHTETYCRSSNFNNSEMPTIQIRPPPPEAAAAAAASLSASSSSSSLSSSAASAAATGTLHYSMSGSSIHSNDVVGLSNTQFQSYYRTPSENDDSPDVLRQLLQLHIDRDDQAFKKIEYSLLEQLTQNFDDTSFYEGGRLLGSGGFGSVYLGMEDKERVAVKRLYDTTEDLIKQFEVELNVLKTFHHENLVPLLAYCCQPRLCLVCVYMVNGSLEDRLARKNQTKVLSIDQRIVIAKGTARGINYLNSNKVVHRDIKSANVLLDANFVAKVSDFATARPGPMGNNTASVLTNVVMGTSAYQAPEARLHDISAKLDSFAFGVVLLELMTSLPAFDMDREDRDLKSHILENYEENKLCECVDRSAGQWSENLISALYRMSMECLNERKKKRVTVAQILPQLEDLENC